MQCKTQQCVRESKQTIKVNYIIVIDDIPQHCSFPRVYELHNPQPAPSYENIRRLLI